MTIGATDRRGGGGVGAGGRVAVGKGGGGGGTALGVGGAGAGSMAAPQRRHESVAGGFSSRHVGQGVPAGSCRPAAPGRRRRVGCSWPWDGPSS